MDEELSDHRMIEIEMIDEGQQRREEQDVREVKWNWRSADWTKMNEMVRRKVAEVQWCDKDVERGAMMLQNLLMVVCEECVERVERRVGGARWWSRELAEMRLEVRRKRRNWIRYREEQDRRLFVVAVAKFKMRIKERKREMWEKDLNEINVLELFGDAYRLMRRGRRTQVVLSTMKRMDGTWTSGEEETMQYILDELLPEDRREEDSQVQARMRMDVREMNMEGVREEKDLLVVEREVEMAISKFKNRTAPGEDGLKAEVLKSVGRWMKEEVAVLMVKMWEEGVFPKIWKRGVVKLLKKSEEKPAEDIKSYRPVTLLPVLGKLSERVIAGWLLAEIEGRLNVRQYGFRKGLGTKDALEKLSRCVSESESKYVFGVQYLTSREARP